MCPTLKYSFAIDLEEIFKRIEAETGLVVTQFDLARMEHGVMNRCTEVIPYRCGDLTWDDVGNGHVEVLRWDGPDTHWPKRLLAARLIRDKHGAEALYQSLLALAVSLSEPQ
jgi:hypothetical protein